MNKKILIVLVGNIEHDARVHKEIMSLLSFGYAVTLVQTTKLKDENKQYPYNIYVINKRSSEGISLVKIVEIIRLSNKLKTIIKQEQPDYIHCNDISALVYAIRFIKHNKVVYDSHELAVECTQGYKKSLIRAIEKCLIPRLHAIIIPQIDRLRYFSFKYPSAQNKLYLLENFPTKFSFDGTDLFAKEFGLNRGGKKIVLYTGVLNDERKIKELIFASIGLEQILLVMIGPSSAEYRDDLKMIIEQHHLANQVYMFDSIPHEKVKALAASADIGVCFYGDKNLNSYFTASNKLYELMDSGTLVLSNDTVGVARVLRPENGVCIKEITIESVRNGLMELLHKGKAPKADYYWENQENVLQTIYK